MAKVKVAVTKMRCLKRRMNPATLTRGQPQRGAASQAEDEIPLSRQRLGAQITER